MVTLGAAAELSRTTDSDVRSVDLARASRHRVRRLAVSATALLLVGLGACSTTTAQEEQKAEGLARELVDASRDAGVAPALTADVAESLFGTDAADICDVFDGGPGAAESVLLGNPALGRAKAISEDSVRFGRLVIKTYCPDVLDDFDAAVADIDPMAVDR